MKLRAKIVAIFANLGIMIVYTISKICVQKVGAVLTKKEIAAKVFAQIGDIVKTVDFVSAGLTNYDVAKLCKQGYIERIRNGFYQLPKNGDIKEEQLIATFLPQGVVCVESALFHYGYSDFAPREWAIAIPRSFSRAIKQMQEVPVKAYYIQEAYCDLGKTNGEFNGVMLPVYDRERTICDCFKYRTKLDNELFNKALNAYVADDKKNLRNLSGYAKQMRVYTKLMNVMEVLLNG